MKKTLLLSTALLIGAGAYAQSNKQYMRGMLYPKLRQAPVADVSEGTSDQKMKNNSVNGVQTSTLFSNARNGYGTINEDNNTVHYNQDLNMVAFINRIPVVASWPVTGLPGGGAVSGYMVMRYSTDNGATWNGVCFANNNTIWQRHPSGVIANTPGNTDPALAKFVGVGPALTNSGVDFNATWFTSIEANATGNVTTNDQQYINSIRGSGTSCDGASVYNNNLVANGMTVWAGARKESVGGFVDRGVAVFKGTTSGGAYTWTQDSVTFGTYVENAQGNFYCSTPKIAFAPDGLTGYVLVNGIQTSATGNATKSLQPNVWKTTDGGSTWSAVNQNYDWVTGHQEILCNLVPTLHDADWNGGANNVYPAFFDAHGSGMTVDANGVLHYVTTVVPAYSSHPDSSYYIYGQYGFGYTQYDDLDKPWVYDFTTDGTGAWNQKLVGKLYTRNIETDDVVSSSGPAIWTMDGTAPMDYSNRVRVSRSTDGTRIFYTWTDGDTNTVVTGTPNTYAANTFPNMEYRGYNVTTGMFSAQKEMSSFDAAEGGYYHHYTSTIAMPTGTGYRIPAVYISSQDQGVNLTNPVDFNYISDMEIDDGEYTESISSNMPGVDPSICTVGLKEFAGNAIAGISQNYPNPFNASTTVKVNLNKAENITLQVMNSVGQVVSTQTVKGNSGINELNIDGANLSNGVYFYSVTAGDSKVTRKMTVVK